jgi:glycosyltransferase involved in cell wall biosynthesis
MGPGALWPRRAFARRSPHEPAMRIAVLDYYHSAVEFKDPGQITLGLGEAGADVFLIPLNPMGPDEQAPFRIERADPRRDEFWAHADADVVLFFSRLDPRWTALVERIKAHGKTVIVKADSDGTLGYPLVPNYLRTLSVTRDPIGWMLRNVKWRLPVKRFVAQKIEQIARADAVIFESPGALRNATRVLAYWGYHHLVDRLHCVPNPVAPDILEAPLRPKENVIVAIGRWQDEGAKNTGVLVRVLADFLRRRPDYRSVILGPGADRVTRRARSLAPSIQARMDIRGSVERPDVARVLSAARICLVPSRMESFHIAAAEALCMGCSVVVTPVESLEYLSARGFSGTVAGGFGPEPVLSALGDDVTKWERKEYDPRHLAHHWRSKLSRRTVAQAIVKIAETVRGDRTRTEPQRVLRRTALF